MKIAIFGTGAVGGYLGGRLAQAGKDVTFDVSGNIISDLWKKFMLISPLGGIGAITRSPIGIFRSLPETREMLIRILNTQKMRQISNPGISLFHTVA